MNDLSNSVGQTSAKILQGTEIRLIGRKSFVVTASLFLGIKVKKVPFKSQGILPFD